MTELCIDGVQVVLPKEMSATVKRENPLFTKNGEYTYEITLQLTNPVNAKLYEHLNRLNSVKELKTKRKALLIADNRRYCDGTEIVTAWTEKTVTIQIASGNSELNYLIGGDMQITVLNMGNADLTDPKQYIEKKYPDVEFCLPPCVMNNGEAINGWSVLTIMSQKEGYSKAFPKVMGVTDAYLSFYAQPYLCSYLKKMMKAIGYELVENQLETSEWSTAYLPQNGHPTEYAQMFPGWSINDFVTEVEKLFNVQLFVNSKKHTVSLLFKNSYYAGQQQVSVGHVEDTYECEESDEDVDVSKSDITLNAPDSTYYKRHHLDEKIISAATKTDLASEREIRNYISDKGYDAVKNYMFFDLNKKRYYIAKPATAAEIPYMEVNMFGDILKNDSSGEEVELKMIPADYKDYSPGGPSDKVEGRFSAWTTDTELTKTTVPLLNGEPVIETTQKGLYDKITGEEESSTEGSSSLYVSFYQGMKELAVWPKVLKDDFDALEDGPFDPQFIQYPFPFNVNDEADCYGNLRISYMNKMLYEGVYEIDLSKATKITSYDVNVYDPRFVFEIRNKRYVCKEIEYTLTPEGRNKAWTGTFYPIKISDTEAYQRWILADGKWRDGGVWLDNGRWLEE